MIFMDAQIELHPKNKAYFDAMHTYIWEAYEMDLPKTDVTTKSFLGRASKTIKAKIIANEDGVLAGIQEAEWFLRETGIELVKAKKDGAFVKKGTAVLEVMGKAGSILGTERTLLNLLQRMSGVATKTKKLVTKLPDSIKLLATRKTLWGLLDKRAVVLGGGGTHRLNLSDAILIKENHIALTKNLKKSLKSALKKLPKVRFVEVEFESLKQVEDFLEVYGKIKKVLKDQQEVAVMLDNFTPRDIKKVIKPLKEAGVHVELSGGINEKNISRYNIGGVSAISSGAITTQAHNLDMSLNIVAGK
jgi:nicotinate-nucleotide pyrophosphorylase (carboxylating)